MTVLEQTIINNIKPNSRVLDCGCGDGALLAALQDQKQVIGYGIDQDQANVAACVSKGVSVYHGDIAEGVGHMADHAFDVVVLSFTLQQIQHPIELIQQLCRVGKQVILTFPNFAYWRNRLTLLTGSIPVSTALPYSWHDTPNIRVISIKSFKTVCAQKQIRILKQVSFVHGRKRWDICANICADEALFIIEKNGEKI